MTLSYERAIDSARLQVSKQLDPDRRSQLGQFMTPTRIADFMVSLFTRWPRTLRLLDPGAGIGSLTESFARQFAARADIGSVLEVDCYEIDSALVSHLMDHLGEIETQLHRGTRGFRSRVHERDFVQEASFAIGMGGPRFTHALLNPPYKKIGAGSLQRRALRSAGFETVNLYAAFLGLSVSLVEPGGEIVACVAG